MHEVASTAKVHSLAQVSMVTSLPQQPADASSDFASLLDAMADPVQTPDLPQSPGQTTGDKVVQPSMWDKPAEATLPAAGVLATAVETAQPAPQGEHASSRAGSTPTAARPVPVDFVQAGVQTAAATAAIGSPATHNAEVPQVEAGVPEPKAKPTAPQILPVATARIKKNDAAGTGAAPASALLNGDITVPISTKAAPAYASAADAGTKDTAKTRPGDKEGKQQTEIASSDQAVLKISPAVPAAVTPVVPLPAAAPSSAASPAVPVVAAPAASTAVSAPIASPAQNSEVPAPQTLGNAPAVSAATLVTDSPAPLASIPASSAAPGVSIPASKAAASLANTHPLTAHLAKAALGGIPLSADGNLPKQNEPLPPAQSPLAGQPSPSPQQPAAISHANVANLAVLTHNPNVAAAAKSRDGDTTPADIHLTPSDPFAPTLTLANSAAQTHASSAAATATTSAQAAVANLPQAPVPLAGIPVLIAGKAAGGNNHFDIRLDPPELGRIEVRLKVDKDGQVSSHLIADRADTLALLRRDEPALQRALQDAGLKTTGDGLQFSLRDQTGGQANGQPARTPLPNQDDLGVSTDPISAVYTRFIGRAGGLDIRV